MGRVLCFCGKKGSGKNTLCSFLHGYQLKSLGIIKDFTLTDAGILVVKVEDESGAEYGAELDVTRRDIEFAEWAAINMWPYVKQYAFAEPLKEICHRILNLDYKMFYGTNEEKNMLSNLKWENMPDKPNKTGFMTAREVMQHVGTNIFRAMKEDVWTSFLERQILSEGSQLSIVTDGRFPNELATINSTTLNGKNIYLTKFLDNDSHASETSINLNQCDAIIDNQNQTLAETCADLIRILNDWGWLGDIND